MKKCRKCGHYPNMHYKCEACGKRVHGGEDFRCPHGRPTPTKGFLAYIDYNISTTPQYISNPGDRKKHLKPHWVDDHIVHLVERD